MLRARGPSFPGGSFQGSARLLSRRARPEGAPRVPPAQPGTHFQGGPSDSSATRRWDNAHGRRSGPTRALPRHPAWFGVQICRAGGGPSCEVSECKRSGLCGPCFWVAASGAPAKRPLPPHPWELGHPRGPWAPTQLCRRALDARPPLRPTRQEPLLSYRPPPPRHRLNMQSQAPAGCGPPCLHPVPGRAASVGGRGASGPPSVFRFARETSLDSQPPGRSPSPRGGLFFPKDGPLFRVTRKPRTRRETWPDTSPCSGSPARPGGHFVALLPNLTTNWASPHVRPTFPV